MVLSSGTTLNKDMSASDALCLIVEAASRDFDLHLTKLMTSEDPEGPHGARVALRRLRSALAGFAPLIDKTVLTMLKSDARTLFRHLGTLRDLDVLAQGLAAARAQRVPQTEHAQIRTKVRDSMITCHAETFGARLRRLFQSDDWKRKGNKARHWQKAPVRKIAIRALGHTWSNCTKNGKSVKKMSQTDRHAFRKTLKALRYLTEFFGDLWPGKPREDFLEQLKKLQDSLGTINDIAMICQKSEPTKTERALLDARMHDALKLAKKDWGKLRKHAPFWA
ncbi:CHAD domain-containing protein [Pseudogemmobacter sp. W21_MBD1_M6]|uniref:CHAD domain-containing protein n=1 Tax=Pseudogemmobacter sp. W21_MBD1_M6 TaxID=3240271 RepID=UPI003F969755